MTLRIHAPNPMRVGETANVLVTSDNPGVVSLTYGAGLTGPATVTIAGTRNFHPNPACGYQWGWNGSDALAALTEARDNVTICFDVDLEYASKQPLSLQVLDQELIAQNYKKGSNGNLHNWLLSFRANSTLYTGPTLQYTQTNAPPTAGAAASVVTLNSAAFGRYLRCAMTFSGTAITLYYHDGTTKRTATMTRTAPTGVVAGPCLALYGAARFAYFSSLLADDATGVDAWLAGNCPASAVVYYPAAEELETQAPWDYSGNDRDGQFGVDATYPLTKAPRTHTDTAPVVPYAIVPVTAVATTGTTIDATRPRQGVPARASEAEKTETAEQCTVTVEAPLVSIGPDTDATVAAYPATIPLHVCATPDGVVSLASDDPNLTVPATVEIVGGSATVTVTALADVTGATVTATYGDTTDTANVSVTEAAAPAETLVIGPDIDTEVESYPAAIILLLTSNVDGDVEIVSDDPNLIPMSPVTVIDGQAEVACLVTADVTGATVTASRDPGPSGSCSVTVSDVLTGDWIAVGPNQRTRIEGKRIVWPIRVRSSKDGAFTATADPPTGIIISGPFEISGGACDITAQPTQAGSWVLTVEQDGRTDSVTLEALTPVAAPTVRQYNLSSEIDGFFDFINRKYGLRPRFTASSVQDVRAEHATDRTYSRYAQGTGQPGSVFGAVALSYQVMISYSSAVMAEQDLGILREEADRYGWNAIGFSMTGQTMFEPIRMMPRLTLTLNFDIIPQGR